MEKSPIRPTDNDARALARDLIAGAKFAALGVSDPATGAPFVSRIAFALDAGGHPTTLISTLSFHTQALQANPACSLLVGEPPDKGDALAFPRLSLRAKAEILPPDQKNFCGNTTCNPIQRRSSTSISLISFSSASP